MAYASDTALRNCQSINQPKMGVGRSTHSANPSGLMKVACGIYLTVDGDVDPTHYLPAILLTNPCFDSCHSSRQSQIIHPAKHTKHTHISIARTASSSSNSSSNIWAFVDRWVIERWRKSAGIFLYARYQGFGVVCLLGICDLTTSMDITGHATVYV